ncbi:MAG: hypothetical protein GY950_37140, partial [bacterium]|nr:hypothetical protein [bacterium]
MYKTLHETIQPGLSLTGSIRELAEDLMSRLEDLDKALPAANEAVPDTGKADPKNPHDFFTIGDFKKQLGVIMNVFHYSLVTEESDILLKGAVRDTALWVLDEVKKNGYFSGNILKSFVKIDFIEFLQGILFDFLTRGARVLVGETEIMKREIEA